MTDMFDIGGRCALITGSSRGLGRVFANGLAAAGARVVVHGRDAQATAAVAAEIGREHGVDTRSSAFDVTDPDAVARAVTAIEAEWGALDILVNNVGVQRRAPFAEFDVDDWTDVVAANLTSAFLVSRHVVPGMVARGSGKVVNIGSVQSGFARPGIAPYAATKGGIVMLTRGMCADLGPAGIQVNTLAPGYLATDMTRALVEDRDFSRWIETRTPAGRWGQPDDLLGALRFLVSDASAFVNGQVLYVDGGMTAVL